MVTMNLLKMIIFFLHILMKSSPLNVLFFAKNVVQKPKQLKPYKPFYIDLSTFSGLQIYSQTRLLHDIVITLKIDVHCS